MAQEPLFETAHAALVFAYGYVIRYYKRPAVSVMMKPGTFSGRGLSGVDGAAQAGIIRALARSCGPLNEAMAIARCAPRAIPCACRAPCCSGWRKNTEWREAVYTLQEHARHAALSDKPTTAAMRTDYVMRYLGERIGMEALTKRHGISESTAARHLSAVRRLLGGTAAGKGRACEPGLESAAFDAVEAALREAGIVGAP
jgi:hypothetical protein